MVHDSDFMPKKNGPPGTLRLGEDGRVSLHFGEDVVFLEKQATLEGAKAQLADAAWIIACIVNSSTPKSP